jgi:nucleoside 2-deoxyribosyltransferase
MEIKGNTFYLAGPLNHDTKLGYNWRERASSILSAYEGKIKDPSKFEPGIDEDPVKCVELDKEMIKESDIVVVNLEDIGDNPSIGTPMEMMYAFESNIDLFVIGYSNHNWVEAHADKKFESFDEFIKFVDINGGFM